MFTITLGIGLFPAPGLGEGSPPTFSPSLDFSLSANSMYLALILEDF